MSCFFVIIDHSEFFTGVIFNLFFMQIFSRIFFWMYIFFWNLYFTEICNFLLLTRKYFCRKISFFIKYFMRNFVYFECFFKFYSCYLFMVVFCWKFFLPNFFCGNYKKYKFFYFGDFFALFFRVYLYVCKTICSLVLIRFHRNFPAQNFFHENYI